MMHRALPSTSEPETTAIPRLWRPRDLARHLGLARESVYRLVKRGDLPAIRVAGVIRIPEGAVLEYLGTCPRVAAGDGRDDAR